MALTINGIVFNDLSRLGVGSQTTNIINPSVNTETKLNTFIANNKEYRNIQSVLIDWNGAELGTINDINLGTINTTGDLLNAIKALANANKYAA